MAVMNSRMHCGRLGPRLRRRAINYVPAAKYDASRDSDLFGDDLASAVLGVAQAALAGEALLLAGNVVGHAREGRGRCTTGLAGGDVDQRVGRVDAVDFACPDARW